MVVLIIAPLISVLDATSSQISPSITSVLSVTNMIPSAVEAVRYPSWIWFETEGHIDAPALKTSLSGLEYSIMPSLS